jgi:Arc/MetJ-type ribon-helix-helix transcriptional regulator
VLDDIGGLRKAAANMGKVFSNKVTVFNAPAGYQAHRKNAMGIEYSVWGTYEGENKRAGLPISFFVHKAASDTGKNAIGDTAMLRFYDASNTLVRTIRTKADAGFNRYFWGMEGRGLRASGGGGRGGRMGGGAGFGGGAPQEAPGLPVDPGTYKVVVSVGRNFSDSTMLVVNDDPYAPTSKEVRDAIRKASARLDKTTEKLNTLNERMTEADGIIAKIEATLRDMDKKAADTIRKTVTVVKDEMKAIREMLNGKPQTKQGYGNIPQVTVSSVFGEARMAVMGKPVAPGAQEDRLITFAEQKVGEVITRANKFFDGTWKSLRTLAEAAPVKIFKDYKTIE